MTSLGLKSGGNCPPYYCKPSFINPKLLENQSISLERLLEDEAAAVAYPGGVLRVLEHPPKAQRHARN
jgi:hypothetical protein